MGRDKRLFWAETDTRQKGHVFAKISGRFERKSADLLSKMLAKINLTLSLDFCYFRDGVF